MNAYNNYISDLSLSEDFKNDLTQKLLSRSAGAKIITPKWKAPRGSVKAKTIAVAAVVTAFFIAAAAILATVLNNRDKGIRLADNEFLIESGNSDSVPSYAAYSACRFENSQFSADNFKLKFYFLNRGNSVPSAAVSIYYINKNTGEQINYVIRGIDDFSSEEYGGEVIYYTEGDLEGSCKITFNHAEEVTIPKDILTNANGTIWLYVYGIDYDMLAEYEDLEEYDEYETVEIDGERFNYCGYVGFEYLLDGDAVTLNSPLYSVYRGNWSVLWAQ